MVLTMIWVYTIHVQAHRLGEGVGFSIGLDKLTHFTKKGLLSIYNLYDIHTIYIL